MNDKELADAVVALGVGEATEWVSGLWRYTIGGDYSGYDLDAGSFIEDWRVAGALMEKIPTDGHGDEDRYFEVAKLEDKYEASATHIEGCYSIAYNKSLPRAIIEACVGALSSS